MTWLLRFCWLALFALGLPAAAAAQNLVPNGDFSIPGELPGWTLYAGQSQAWDDEDADLCPESGSAVGASTIVPDPDPSALLLWWGPCIEVPAPLDAFAFELRIRLEPGSDVPLFRTVGVEAFYGPACAGASELDIAHPDLGETWQTVHLTATTGQPVVSLRPYLALEDFGVLSFAARIDRVLLAVDEPVFLDDLEGGSTCRWSDGS